LAKAVDVYHATAQDPVHVIALAILSERNSHASLIEERDRLREALQNVLGVYDTPVSRRRFPQDEFMKEAIAIARAALSPTAEGREP
jgi:hypothetical protein